jgi:hypothetical protein
MSLNTVENPNQILSANRLRNPECEKHEQEPRHGDAVRQLQCNIALYQHIQSLHKTIMLEKLQINI